MKIYKIASTENDISSLKDTLRSMKDDLRDVKRDYKDVASKVKKIDDILEKLNIGTRRISQVQNSYTELQRKVERFEVVAQEWKKYKANMEDNIKKLVEKHTKAQITDVAPQAN